MSSRPASIQSRQNPDLVIEPVTWNQLNKRPSSSGRGSLQSQKNSPYTISGVDWPTRKSPRNTTGSNIPRAMPGLVIEGVGPSSTPGSHLPLSTGYDKPPRIPARATERQTSPAGSHKAIQPKAMPPTAWRQYDPPHSPLPEPGLSTSSSTDDESGPSSRERSDSSWSHEDPKYPNKEAVRGPYGVVEQPLNFQLGNSKTLEALCGPESQTDERSISQRSDSGDDGDDEVPADVVSSYQSLIPDSPYFEDFDYARPDSNLDDDSGDLRGRPAESGRKTVRFESYESFKTARSEPDDDVPAMEIDQCYDFSHDVPVVNGQWQASSFTGSDPNQSITTQDAIGYATDARRPMQPYRLTRGLSAEDKQPVLDDPSIKNIGGPETSTASFSSNGDLPPIIAGSSSAPNRSLSSPQPPYQHSRVTWSTMPIARHSSTSPQRLSVGSPLSRDDSSSSLVTLQNQQPRHPLAFSQLPPPSPSTTPDSVPHPSAVSEPAKSTVEKKQRNRLRKKKQSISQRSSNVESQEPAVMEHSVGPSFSTRLSLRASQSQATADMDVPISNPRNMDSEPVPSSQSRPPSSTTNDTKSDPKFKHFASAVVNYYRPSKISDSEDTEHPNTPVGSKTSTPPTSFPTSSKPRRRSFRASNFFSRSRRSSDAQDNSDHAIDSDSSTPGSRSSSRPGSSNSIIRRSLSGRSPVITPVSVAQNPSRDASPKRQDPTPEPPKSSSQSFPFSRTKHPSRASVKIEPVSVPPIPTIPAQHRNASPIPSSSVSSTRSSSFSGPVIPPGKYPPGHQLVSTADLAAFNNSKTEVLLFRRFDSVHKRILNDMQDRIVTLEAELSQLDQFLSDSTDVLTSDQNQKQPNSGQLGPEGGIARARSRRLTVIHDLKSSLRDYDDLLLKFNSLRIPPGNDQKTSINKFKTWLTKNGPTPPPPNPTNSSMPSSGSTTPTNAKPSTTTMSNNNNTTSSSLTFPFFHPSPPSSRPNSSSSTISTTTRPTSANPSSSSSQPPTYLPVRAATITPSTTTSSASAAAAPTQAQAIAQVDPNLKAAAAMVMAGASLGDGKRPRTSRRGVTG